MSVSHAVTVAGRTFVIVSSVTPGWHGDKESQPEPADVHIEAIREGDREVDIADFDRIVYAAGHDESDWWWCVEGEIIKADAEARAAAMKKSERRT